MSRFEPDDAYGCVVLGASSVTLLDPAGRRELFRRVRKCLAPEGRFLLTVLNADGNEGCGEDGGWNDGGTTVSTIGEDSFLITVENRDPVNGARRVTMIHVCFNEGGTYRSSAYTSEVAFVSNDLIEEEIASAGLRIFERRPVRITSRVPGQYDVELWVCG